MVDDGAEISGDVTFSFRVFGKGVRCPLWSEFLVKGDGLASCSISRLLDPEADGVSFGGVFRLQDVPITVTNSEHSSIRISRTLMACLR